MVKSPYAVRVCVRGTRAGDAKGLRSEAASHRCVPIIATNPDPVRRRRHEASRHMHRRLNNVRRRTIARNARRCRATVPGSLPVKSPFLLPLSPCGEPDKACRIVYHPRNSTGSDVRIASRGGRFPHFFYGRITGCSRPAKLPRRARRDRLRTVTHACCGDLPRVSECRRESAFGGRFRDAQGGSHSRCFGRAAAT
jgi:hypothetical protein